MWLDSGKLYKSCRTDRDKRSLHTVFTTNSCLKYVQVPLWRVTATSGSNKNRDKTKVVSRFYSFGLEWATSKIAWFCSLHVLKFCESASTVLFICMFTEFSINSFEIEIELNQSEDILYQSDSQCYMVQLKSFFFTWTLKAEYIDTLIQEVKRFDPVDLILMMFIEVAAVVTQQ